MRRIVGSMLALALWLVPASAAGAAIDFAKTRLPRRHPAKRRRRQPGRKEGPRPRLRACRECDLGAPQQGQRDFHCAKALSNRVPRLPGRARRRDQQRNRPRTGRQAGRRGALRHLRRPRPLAASPEGETGASGRSSSVRPQPRALWSNQQPQTFTLARMRKSGPPVVILPVAGSILGPPPITSASTSTRSARATTGFSPIASRFPRAGRASAARSSPTTSVAATSRR